jgi:hypothetical protein
MDDKKVPDKKEQDEVSKARELLIKAEKEKTGQCFKEIDEVLKKYGYSLDVRNTVFLKPIRQ